MRYLGVDPGGRRMGLAVGDDETGVVTPLEIEPYENARAAASRLVETASEHGADVVVIGLPTTPDGNRTGACARSEKLAREVERLGLPVHLQPEFLTSDEARRRARERGLPAGEPVDHLAAQVILEEFLSGRP